MADIVALSDHKDRMRDGEIEELLGILRDKLKRGCPFVGVYVDGEDLGLMHGNLESQYHGFWLFEHGKEALR